MLRPNDALRFIQNKFNNVTTNTVFDYGDYYVIYPVDGDMSDEAYKVNKETGDISEYTFSDYITYMRNIPDDVEVPKYVIDK